MRPTLLVLAFSSWVLTSSQVYAFQLIAIDYTYDTNNFFDTTAKRDALKAAADRWSSVITSTLLPVAPGGTGSGTPAGWRIGFSHPGIVNSNFQLSTASGSGTDPLIGAGAANGYGFPGLQANKWILYAGGRNLGSALGEGGTGTGVNFTTTFDDLNGPMHRGLIGNTPGFGSSNDLPVWGGSVSFNTATSNWHFGISTAAPIGQIDFYSIALHEIGHALGLSLSFNQWTNNVSGSNYNGANAVKYYNEDNGTSVTSLAMVDAGNFHWQDGAYDSKIYALGNPNYAGTVGAGVLQDLLMEPIANFTGTVRRLEITNADVGALQDLGWNIAIPEPTTYVMAGVIGLFALTRLRKKQEDKEPKATELAPSSLS